MTNEDRRGHENRLRALAARWQQLSQEDMLVALWMRMGFSEEEIAIKMGKSLSAVRGAYRRAIALMR